MNNKAKTIIICILLLMSLIIQTSTVFSVVTTCEWWEWWCVPCGDGFCDEGAGEECGGCPEDCGGCGGGCFWFDCFGTCNGDAVDDGCGCNVPCPDPCAGNTNCGECGNPACDPCAGNTNCGECGNPECDGAVCGDSICAISGEDCNSCPGDCGACSCTDECSSLGAKTCSGNVLQTCGNYDTDSCLDLGADSQCSGTCSNGACDASCSDDCAPLGATQCGGGNLQTCGNYDADTCIEWNAGSSCSPTACIGSYPNAECSTQITPTISMWANPNMVDCSTLVSVSLNWASNGVGAQPFPNCELTGPGTSIGNLNPDGSATVDISDSPGTFTIVCNLVEGTIADSASVECNPGTLGYVVSGELSPSSPPYYVGQPITFAGAFGIGPLDHTTSKSIDIAGITSCSYSVNGVVAGSTITRDCTNTPTSAGDYTAVFSISSSAGSGSISRDFTVDSPTLCGASYGTCSNPAEPSCCPNEAASSGYKCRFACLSCAPLDQYSHDGLPCCSPNVPDANNQCKAPKKADGQPCTADSECQSNNCVTVYRDLDGDGYGCSPSTTVCTGLSGYSTNGGDCGSDDNPNVNPGVAENCNNGIDDNNNGDTDCTDSACSSNPSCPESNCNNGADDNSNGATDCADSSCSSAPNCVEICNDNIDNNNNGKTDCYDTSSCSGSPSCTISLSISPNPADASSSVTATVTGNVIGAVTIKDWLGCSSPNPAICSGNPCSFTAPSSAGDYGYSACTPTPQSDDAALTVTATVNHCSAALDRKST